MKVKLDNAGKTFLSLRGRIQALEKINLEVKDGEFFVLLGPSGCGKSTLLNMVAGLEKNTTGKIYFDEQVVADGDRRFSTEAGQRNVAFVFQSYALYPHMDVFHNIAFPLKIAGMTKSEIATQVRQTADRLDIANLLSAKPSELSGGQRQRVAIARAIVRKPNVFLLDEPLSNLDARLRTAMRAELKELQQQLGTTTIYVTHDQTEAMALGQRIALLKHGKIQQLGSPEELYDQPRNMFAAKFIGSPPMNFIPAMVKSQNQHTFIQVGDCKLEPPTKQQTDLANLKDQEFELGIRPEDLEIMDAAEMGKLKNALPAQVQAVEPLGRETFIHLKLENREITVIKRGQKKMKAGETVALMPDLNRIHAFKRTEDDSAAINLCTRS